MRGKFITLEGCDGSGKSTQIELLKQALTKRGIGFAFTREPGGTEISERIRGIISDPTLSNMDSVTELLLYTAARRQHVAEFIEKELSKGKLVFCDRFIHSTVAYQGYGRGIDLKLIERCNAVALGNCSIDLTLFFDLPPKEAFLRKGGADKRDRLECEEFSFYERVYSGYKALSKGEEVEVIDARGNIDEVHKRVMQALAARGIL